MTATVVTEQRVGLEQPRPPRQRPRRRRRRHRTREPSRAASGCLILTAVQQSRMRRAIALGLVNSGASKGDGR